MAYYNLYGIEINTQAQFEPYLKLRADLTKLAHQKTEEFENFINSDEIKEITDIIKKVAIFAYGEFENHKNYSIRYIPSRYRTIDIDNFLKVNFDNKLEYFIFKDNFKKLKKQFFGILLDDPQQIDRLIEIDEQEAIQQLKKEGQLPSLKDMILNPDLILNVITLDLAGLAKNILQDLFSNKLSQITKSRKANQELFTEETKKTLVQSYFESIVNLHFVVIDYVNQVSPNKIKILHQSKLDEANRIGDSLLIEYDTISSVDFKSKIENIFNINPTNEQATMCLLLKYGDKQCSIQNYCKDFKIDFTSIQKNIIRNLFQFKEQDLNDLENFEKKIKKTIKVIDNINADNYFIAQQKESYIKKVTTHLKSDKCLNSTELAYQLKLLTIINKLF